MKLLLDTCVALWLVNEHEKLSSKAKALLLDNANALYIIIVSAWEIAVKASLGKLPGLNGGVGTFLAKINDMPISLLPVAPRHLETVETLPFIHRDPFDRLLVATVKVDAMTILTTDENIHKYDVPYIW